MPTRPRSHCSRPGCRNFKPCQLHSADAQRPTAAERGYNGKRWSSARRSTLKRDPFCMCTEECTCDWFGAGLLRCPLISNVADHYPDSRKDLIARGELDPDHPRFLRGLNRSCHSRETNRLQPGGWNDRI